MQRRPVPIWTSWGDTIRGLSVLLFFPKKRRELFEIATSLDKELKHFGGIQTIRWVSSQHRALKPLLDNFETTIDHLEHIATKSDENGQKAKGFLKEMKSNRFLSFLNFMLDWNNCITIIHINKHFAALMQDE